MEKDQANIHKRQANETILTPEKRDFIPKLFRREKEEHNILTKGKIHQENIAILNICAPNTMTLTFIKETLRLLKSHIDAHTRIVGDFSAQL